MLHNLIYSSVKLNCIGVFIVFVKTVVFNVCLFMCRLKFSVIYEKLHVRLAVFKF